MDVSQVRDLRGVVEREKAQIGVLISLHEPTRPMHTEAAAAGHYMTGWDDLYPRLQLLTVADLLAGKAAAYPSWGVNRTYREAPRVRPQQEQPAQVPLWTPGTAEPGLS